MARASNTYRASRRNEYFGRGDSGNRNPADETPRVFHDFGHTDLINRREAQMAADTERRKLSTEAANENLDVSLKRATGKLNWAKARRQMARGR